MPTMAKTIHTAGNSARTAIPAHVFPDFQVTPAAAIIVPQAMQSAPRPPTGNAGTPKTQGNARLVSPARTKNTDAILMILAKHEQQ